MKTLTYRTNKGKGTLQCPESWDEVTVEQYLRYVKEWDGEDWIQLFSIMSGMDVDDVSTSTNGQIENALYECIEFVFRPYDWAALKIPKELELKALWLKDNPLMAPCVKLPEKIGRLSIGQAIQARRSLEDVKDLREGISIVTAIYLQPLVDGGKFDHFQAIQLEQLILKNRITKIYPVGFFLLTQLKRRGSWLGNVLSRLKRMSTRKGRPSPN